MAFCWRIDGLKALQELGRSFGVTQASKHSPPADDVKAQQSPPVSKPEKPKPVGRVSRAARCWISARVGHISERFNSSDRPGEGSLRGRSDPNRQHSAYSRRIETLTICGITLC